MVRFGGNQFTGLSVPLVCGDRYFFLEPGEEVVLGVLTEHEERPVFEVLRNQPVENPLTDVSLDDTGLITVTEKLTERVVYRLRPGPEATVRFTKVGAGGADCKITAESIQAAGTTIASNAMGFGPGMAAVCVLPNGGVAIGMPLPARIVKWIEDR